MESGEPGDSRYTDIDSEIAFRRSRLHMQEEAEQQGSMSQPAPVSGEGSPQPGPPSLPQQQRCSTPAHVAVPDKDQHQLYTQLGALSSITGPQEHQMTSVASNDISSIKWPQYHQMTSIASKQISNIRTFLWFRKKVQMNTPNLSCFGVGNKSRKISSTQHYFFTRVVLLQMATAQIRISIKVEARGTIWGHCNFFLCTTSLFSFSNPPQKSSE